ncbi:MAG TPA: 50S ribosomal protein L4 [Fimbriimonadaceae bacterium]|nr:50S ribosomal protein L4 [Fimbriimonadaceae bacterium]
MATLEIKDKKGKVVGKHELNAKLAEASSSPTSLHRAVVAEEANSRQGTQSAKTRSEVRGGGRKPYKQKKTGNARQGTIRAPHYAHGGVALAVKPRDYEKKVNRRERRAAILTAFASHVAAGNVTVSDKIAFAAPKTKDASEFIAGVGLKDARKVLVILAAYDEATYRSFRNIPNVTVRTAPASTAGGAEAAKTQAFSARDLLVATNILVAKDALTKIEEVWAK